MEAVLDYLMPDLLTFYLVIFGGAFKKGLTSITDFFYLFIIYIAD